MGEFHFIESKSRWQYARGYFYTLYPSCPACSFFTSSVINATQFRCFFKLAGQKETRIAAPFTRRPTNSMTKRETSWKKVMGGSFRHNRQGTSPNRRPARVLHIIHIVFHIVMSTCGFSNPAPNCRIRRWGCVRQGRGLLMVDFLINYGTMTLYRFSRRRDRMRGNCYQSWRKTWKRNDFILLRLSIIPQTSSTSATPTALWPPMLWPAIND